ncbi:PEP-CTERM protein-sorting domain-containing protein [Prosthecobacter debontii]|uniref:PEP-CTERM protein-sorting domain-containing protein n=1 Tax=Prosthecobacter debontii TaxID=48467 RepID=A0A1T4WRI6_9BACT|nr:PEP-CTERM sorting domain-containing protein [Prosthecobacter debontii]SKA79980.1 PEP-CTERM protein-sorting domain-containing protein [Prosthecobacter debontii]
MRFSLCTLGIAALMTLLPVVSPAASVLITNVTHDGSTNAIVSSTGTALQNVYVGVGYFSGLSDTQLQNLDAIAFDLVTSGGAFEALDEASAWWAFGAGALEGNAQAPILEGSDFIGESIYSIIGNAATLADSTELLIFKHSGLFQEDSPFFNASAIIDLSSGNATLLWGSSTAHSGNYFGEGIQAAYSTAGASSMVPEPSRLLFLLISSLGLLLRRRR